MTFERSAATSYFAILGLIDVISLSSTSSGRRLFLSRVLTSPTVSSFVPASSSVFTSSTASEGASAGAVAVCAHPAMLSTIIIAAITIAVFLISISYPPQNPFYLFSLSMSSRISSYVISPKLIFTTLRSVVSCRNISSLNPNASADTSSLFCLSSVSFVYLSK